MSTESMFAHWDIEYKKELVCMKINTPEDQYLCFMEKIHFESLKNLDNKRLFDILWASELVLENGIVIKSMDGLDLKCL